MKLSTLVLVVLLFSSPCFANVCLNAESVEELKRDFPVVIVGKVLKKTAVANGIGVVNLKISVVRYLKGRAGQDYYDAETFERFPESERPVYKVNKLYAFPVQRYDIKTKGKEYDIIIPSQGCKIIPVDPK